LVDHKKEQKMKKAWGLIIEMVFCALVFTACASLANQGEASSSTGGKKQKIRTALELLAKAIRANDKPAIDSCIIVSNDGAGAMVKAAMHQNGAIRSLQDAWAAKFFKDPMQFKNLSFVFFPRIDGGFEVLIEKTLENLDDQYIQVNGNMARVPIRLTRGNVPPAESPVPFEWSAAWIALVKGGAGWKVDMGNTLRVNVVMSFYRGSLPQSSEQDQKIAADFENDVTAMLETAAKAIADGRLLIAAEASVFVELKTGEVFGKYHLAGINQWFAPAKPASYEVRM
jgi:hypothetical protein